MDDEALIVSARSGDRRALGILLQRHYERVWRLCRRLAGNDADGQDATQEALIAIARGLHGFDGRAAFTTWSYRVATNACLDELRRRSRRPTPFDQSAEDAPTAGVGAVAPAAADQVAERLAVDDAMNRLTEEYRAPVVLRDLCDLDYAEIAEILEIPPGTVRSRISRGRAELAQLLRATTDAGNQPPVRQRPTKRP